MPRLYHIDEGDGDALVLLHSGGMTHEEWTDHLPAFTHRFRVIAPDLPGHGSSPLEGDRLHIPNMANAVLDLLDELGIDEAHVVGSSMGGAVALSLALDTPDRVDQLVLYRISHRRPPDAEDNAEWMADPAHWVEMGLADKLSTWHEPQGGPEAWKQVIGRVADTLRPGYPGRETDTQALASIQAPTLIIVGDRDPLVPLEHALAMYETIPEADLWVIPHATHVTATSTWRREIFDKEVFRFLRTSRHG